MKHVNVDVDVDCSARNTELVSVDVDRFACSANTEHVCTEFTKMIVPRGLDMDGSAFPLKTEVSDDGDRPGCSPDVGLRLGM
jgi:hypothetical protein